MKWTLDEAEAARLGATLRRIDPALMRSDPARPSAWFQGGEAYLDVFIESTSSGIAWLQITVRGRSVTWQRGQGLKTGATNELSVESGFAKTKTIVDDKGIDQELVAFVRVMLGAAVSDPLIRSALDVLA